MPRLAPFVLVALFALPASTAFSDTFYSPEEAEGRCVAEWRQSAAKSTCGGNADGTGEATVDQTETAVTGWMTLLWFLRDHVSLDCSVKAYCQYKRTERAGSTVREIAEYRLQNASGSPTELKTLRNCRGYLRFGSC
ncbi:MAG: hypothetical protein OXF72_02925 [Gammaproteobacteria bacterium]|nr:hypothetical protein [Gammaproteobacteria bacterium]MCY4199193.1 hypothetical protein [Gammaproteobacteria bacterium]MCY4279012.1 hypothetical protein [Gammaproteobacteria bacterium]